MQTADGIWEEAGLAERRLAGLSVNPAAPQEVLLRLLADGPLPARMVLARDRVLTDALADAVAAHPDFMTRRFLAVNPHTDPAHRARLVDDDHWLVRAQLMGGPRPKDTPLLPLPDAAVERILTTYGSAELVWPEVWRQTSVAFRRAMPHHREARVRRFVPGPWRAWPDETREALLNDPDEEVRATAQACQREEDPAWVERELPANACHKRFAMLIGCALSRAVVERILADEDGAEDRHAMAMNRALPADAVARLAVDPDPRVRLAASVHPALTEDERAAIDYQVPVDETFGYEPEAVFPRQLADVCRDAGSRHPLLRRAAARDHRLPADLVARLAADDDLGVRVLLAQNHPDAPPALLLGSFLDYTGPQRGRLAARAQFPTAGLARFADHQDPQVRALAARDPEATAATVDRLTRDPDPDVRGAAARHPGLPQARLAELLDDEELAHRAAANPALDRAVMEQLLAACAG